MKKLLLSSLLVALIAGVVVTEINADIPHIGSRKRAKRTWFGLGIGPASHSDERDSRSSRDYRQEESGRNSRKEYQNRDYAE